MDHTSSNPELTPEDQADFDWQQGTGINFARVGTAWTLQGMFNSGAVIVRHRNSLMRFATRFVFHALPAAPPSDASLLRVTHAIDAQHGQPRRILWIWSDSNGLQAIIKPALDPVDATDGPITLIPVTKSQHATLNTRDPGFLALT